VIKADEGEILSLDTHHPPRSNEYLDLLTTFNKPPNLSPTPPIPKALKQNFCHFISEPFLAARNSELRTFEEMVQSMCEESPSSTIQTSKGKDLKRVSKIKRDLFAWQILFQPELKQEEELLT